MKIILSFLIIAQIYTCDCSVYDWNVKTIERGSDFDDDLKVQTALNNELQKDLRKISGKKDDNDEFNYVNFKKTYDLKKNLAEENRKLQDSYAYKNKYDGKSNLKYLDRQENVDQQNNFKHKQPHYDNDYNEIDDSDDDKHHRQYQRYHCSKQDHASDQIDDKPNNNDNHYNYMKSDQYKHNNNNEDNNIEHNYIHIEHDSDRHNDQKIDRNEDDNDHNEYGHKLNNLNRHDNKDANREENIPICTKKEKENESGNDNDNEKTTNNDYALVASHCPAKGPDIENFVGTNLFDNVPKKCFSTEELALLNARRDFESLLPKDLPQCLLNDRMAAVLMKYFYICHQMIIKMSTDASKDLAQKAYYDTLGGYLNYYLVPVAKYSYYGGHISLNTVKNVLTLHQHSKKFINTNGNGWRAPLKNVLNELKTVRIEPLHIDEGKSCDESSFCMHLDLSSNQNDPDDDKLIVPIPSLEADDTNGYLGNILLPFRRKRTFDLRSENSAYVVVKFYETLTKCYQFQNISQESYNKKFRFWLLENIHVHLSDEQFYPGLGAVLRIYEFLKRGKKEITIYGDEFGTPEYDEDAKVSDTHNWKRKLERESNLEKEHNRNYMQSRELLNILSKSKLLKKKSNAEKDAVEESDMNLLKSDESQKHSDEKSEYQEQEKETKEKLSKEPQNGATKVDASKLGSNAVQTAATPNSVIKMRTLELTPSQMYVIAIPAIAFTFIILICCYKCCCKKKKLQISPSKKDSSSSSSNLINSPVRFFYVKPKSASGKSTTSMDYSTSNRGKKSVKIDKKANNTDTSASSSPKKNKK